MRRSAMNKSKPQAERRLLAYVAGVRGRVRLTVPIMSTAEIRKSLKLSAASKRRVELAMEEAGVLRKSG